MSVSEIFAGLSYFEKLKTLGRRIDAELTYLKSIQDCACKSGEEVPDTVKRLADLLDEALAFKNESLEILQGVEKVEEDVKARLHALKAQSEEAFTTADRYIKHLQQYGFVLPAELRPSSGKSFSDETYSIEPVNTGDGLHEPELTSDDPDSLRRKENGKETFQQLCTPRWSGKKSKIPCSSSLGMGTPSSNLRSYKPHRASDTARANVAKKYQAYLEKDDGDCTITELGLNVHVSKTGREVFGATPKFRANTFSNNTERQKENNDLFTVSPFTNTMVMGNRQTLHSDEQLSRTQVTPEKFVPSARPLVQHSKFSNDRTPSPPVLKSVSHFY